MKKVLVVALALVMGLGFAALANQARIGGFVLHDYCYLWDFNVPQVSQAQFGTCQSANSPFNLVISGLYYGERAWLYALTEENQLIYIQLVTHNGINPIIVPSLYNNGNWKPGWQVLTVILSSTPRFNVGDQHRPQTITAKKFLGYPCIGYVVIRQFRFYVPGSYCSCAPCCWWTHSRDP